MHCDHVPLRGDRFSVEPAPVAEFDVGDHALHREAGHHTSLAEPQDRESFDELFELVGLKPLQGERERIVRRFYERFVLQDIECAWVTVLREAMTLCVGVRAATVSRGLS